MAQVRIDYMPTPKQAMFHASTAHEVLYGGAAGGGKSKAIVMDAAIRCLMYPGFRAYLFRRTYPELEGTLIAEALRSVPPQLAKYAGTAHEMRFTNGSIMLFRHCQSEKDVYDYQGAEMHALYVDELTHFSKGMYDYLKSRLRAPTRYGIVPVTRCASNPGNIGHGWVKAQFVDAGPYGQVVSRLVRSETLGTEEMRTLQYIPAKAMDNPHITGDYIIELEQKPEALRRALLNGDWDAFEGQVFMEFRNDRAHWDDHKQTHAINPFKIPLHWRRYRSMDWGYSKPFSIGWWAVAPSGTAYRYREWYGSTGEPDVGLQMEPTEVARRILEIEAEERREGVSFLGVADPAIWDMQTGESIEQKMARTGVYFDKADNTRIAGKMQVHYRLAFDADGHPGMYIFNTCRDWLRTVPALPYSLTKPEDVDTKSEDHAYDETRYFLMAWPTAPKATSIKKRLLFDPLNQNED